MERIKEVKKEVKRKGGLKRARWRGPKRLRMRLKENAMERVTFAWWH
jgi:hypothetical protein